MKRPRSVSLPELPGAWASKFWRSNNARFREGGRPREYRAQPRESVARLHRKRKMPQEHSKRYRKAAELVEAQKAYPLKEAVGVIAKFPKAKFNESVDLAFKLGVDPKQSDQMVRGTVPLPHGSGKTVRVLVFAQGQ